MDFSELKTKYANFFNYSYEIKVEDTALAEKYILQELEVELSIENNETSGAIFKIVDKEQITSNVDGYSILSSFGPMKKIEISLGYADTNTTVFKGYIFQRNIEITSGLVQVLTIYCLDHKALLRGNITSVAHMEVSSISGLVTKVLTDYAMEKSIDTTDDFTASITVTQGGISDFDYVCKLANEMDFEFFAENGKVYFRKARSNTASLITFTPSDIKKLNMKTSMAGIHSKITLSSYNQDKAESKTGSAESVSDKVGTGSTGIEILTATSITNVQYVGSFTNTRLDKELATAAQALVNKESMALCELTIDTWGIPEAVVGRMITISGMSADINNTYYIKKVKHTLKGKCYNTSITCYSNTISN